MKVIANNNPSLIEILKHDDAYLVGSSQNGFLPTKPSKCRLLLMDWGYTFSKIVRLVPELDQ